MLKVGAATESELKEKKSRIEDALQATRAAVEEGIVAGGGVALVNAIPALDGLEGDAEEMVGVSIIRKALEAPMRAIAENAGFEGQRRGRRGQEGRCRLGSQLQDRRAGRHDLDGRQRPPSRSRAPRCSPRRPSRVSSSSPRPPSTRSPRTVRICPLSQAPCRAGGGMY